MNKRVKKAEMEEEEIFILFQESLLICHIYTNDNDTQRWIFFLLNLFKIAKLKISTEWFRYTYPVGIKENDFSFASIPLSLQRLSRHVLTLTCAHRLHQHFTFYIIFVFQFYLYLIEKGRRGKSLLGKKLMCHPHVEPSAEFSHQKLSRFLMRNKFSFFLRFLS